MNLRPEGYHEAALGKVEGARRLHDSGRFAQSIYLSGLAAECMLRAFRTRRDPEFDSGHDLRNLYKASGILDFIPDRHGAEFGERFTILWARWKNDYRYASEDRLRAEYKRLMFDRGVFGDSMKHNSKIVLDSALPVISIGALTWKSLQK